MADHVDEEDCPVCAYPLELGDVNFKPCPCGFQLCGFCYHEILISANPSCPSCRAKYLKTNITFTAPSEEELAQRLRSKREKLRKSKLKPAKVDKQALGKIRVLQRNLVYVTNLAPEFAREDLLSKMEYFGQYGKIRKVAINSSKPTASGSVSAYITFEKPADAHYAILAVDGFPLGGRTMKAAFGTTKYCSLFLRDMECPNSQCMYLHEVGAAQDSFTKEDMDAGKHLGIAASVLTGSGSGAVSVGASNFKGPGVLPPHGTVTRNVEKVAAEEKEKDKEKEKEKEKGKEKDKDKDKGKEKEKEKGKSYQQQRRSDEDCYQDDPNEDFYVWSLGKHDQKSLRDLFPRGDDDRNSSINAPPPSKARTESIDPSVIAELGRVLQRAVPYAQFSYYTPGSNGGLPELVPPQYLPPDNSNAILFK